MVLLLLEVKADLENVSSIKLPKGATYTLNIKNSSGDDTRDGVTATSAEKVELAGSRGTANFAIKWVKDARSQANLNVLEDIKGLPLQYTDEDAEARRFAPLVGFECRGLEPIAWQPQDGFIVTTASGHRFEDVDLSDDWADFDEKAGESVSIMALEWRFVVKK